MKNEKLEKQASSEIAESREPEEFDCCEDCGFEICQCEADFIESDFMDCGMMHDGTCSKAGSEECDWECPFSH